MCGIVGYIGHKNACQEILKGLQRLEYRGYDSAGVAVRNNGKFSIVKTIGKVADLRAKIGDTPLPGTVGIGHTRWATHGGVTTPNAHPHADEKQRLVLVHNGIIENFRELREDLISRGVRFLSDTDTEVAAQVLAELYNGEPVDALSGLFRKCRGAFAFAVIFGDRPDELYCVRKGAPLVVAMGDDEAYCASDVPAVVEHADRVIFLNEGEICRLTRGKAEFWDLDCTPHEREEQIIEVDEDMIDKAGYPHFMLKEINEQGAVLRRALHGRISTEGIDMHDEWGITAEDASRFTKLHFVACGSSYYAACIAERVLEKYLGLDITVDIASEYRYRPVKADKNTMAVFVSQSGETLDTLEALRHIRRKDAYTIAATNSLNSSIAREVDTVLALNAGIEIGVAATKTFIAQLAALILAGLYLAKLRGELSPVEEKRLVTAMNDLPYKIEQIFTLRDSIRHIASLFPVERDFLYLGRGISYPVAMEGALKLKEISYVHAEAYAAGEMKHGPIALLDEHVPVVVVAPNDGLFEKTVSNVQETRARKAPVVFLTDESAGEIADVAGIIRVPVTEPELTCFLNVIPLQMLAYEAALLRGNDIDQPRNLAKSVTVE